MAGSNPWALKDLEPSPQVGGGLPMYAASWQQAVAPRPQRDDDTLLALAMLNRYEHQQPLRAASSMASEMIPNTRIPVKLERGGIQSARTGKPLFGAYQPEEGAIHLNMQEPKFEQMATLPHEVAHAADDIQGYTGGAHSSAGDTNHHQYFSAFEPEMAQSMDAQRAIENGWPVNPDLLRQYPWLQSVNPDSSNKLANPWNFNF